MQKQTLTAIFAMIVIAIATTTLNAYVNRQKSETMPVAFAEGNPDDEGGPGTDDGGGWVGWKKGYKHVQILDWVGFEVGTQPSVNIQWIDCCKKASQMDACDSQMEHERCAYHSL